MALEGSLKEFSLPDILQLLFFQKKTGVLVLQGRFDRVRLLFFDGNIVGAESRKRDTENRLGKVLLKRGIISQDNVQSILDKQKTEGGKFGAVLIKDGYATKEEVQKVITFQMTETLMHLFSWTEGKYEFLPQSIPIDKDIGVVLNTEQFLMEGVRLVDEWSEIKDKISVDTVFLPQGAEPDEELTEEEKNILAHVDGVNDVVAIADVTGVDSFSVSSVLLKLVEKGVVAAKKIEKEGEKEETVAPVKPIPGLKPILTAMFSVSILIAVAIVAVSPTKQWRSYKTWRMMEQIRQEIEIFKFENGGYPQSVQNTDAWGNYYMYEAVEGGYVLRSMGPDGQPNTHDDIK